MMHKLTMKFGLSLAEITILHTFLSNPKNIQCCCFEAKIGCLVPLFFSTRSLLKSFVLPGTMMYLIIMNKNDDQ